MTKYIAVTVLGESVKKTRMFDCEEAAIRHGYKECDAKKYADIDMVCHVINLINGQTIWSESWGV